MASFHQTVALLLAVTVALVVVGVPLESHDNSGSSSAESDVVIAERMRPRGKPRDSAHIVKVKTNTLGNDVISKEEFGSASQCVHKLDKMCSVEPKEADTRNTCMKLYLNCKAWCQSEALSIQDKTVCANMEDRIQEQK